MSAYRNMPKTHEGRLQVTLPALVSIFKQLIILKPKKRLQMANELLLDYIDNKEVSSAYKKLG